MSPDRVASTLALAGIFLGSAALILQASLTIPSRMALGASFFGAAEFFFSFFTILMNMMLVACYAAWLSSEAAAPRFLRSPRVIGGAAVYAIVTLIVYATILQQQWRPQGLWLLADASLHYVAPPLFVAFWIAASPVGATRLRDVPSWLIAPLVYLIFAMARGSISGLYPYPFLDITKLGLGATLFSIFGVMLLFLAVSLAVVAVDRLRLRLAAEAP